MLRNLRMAIRDQRPFRRSLAWAVIAHANGYIEVRTAPVRRTARVTELQELPGSLASGPVVSK